MKRKQYPQNEPESSFDSTVKYILLSWEEPLVDPTGHEREKELTDWWRTWPTSNRNTVDAD